MNTNLYFESFALTNQALPIKIFPMSNDSSSLGCDFHWHEQIEFYYVTSGSMTVNTGGASQTLTAGDIGYVSWGEPHRGSNFADGTKHYIIQIESKSLQFLKDHPILNTPSQGIDTFIHNDTLLAQLFTHLITEFKDQQAEYELEVMATFMRIFTHILRNHYSPRNNSSNKKHTSSLRHVHEILHYLSMHFKEPLKLDLLAHDLALSKAYMCRTFKKHTGKTIITHYNEQKCHFAASLIQDGSSLQEVADLVGFDDYNYFSRTFKQIMGASPSDYK